MRNFAGAEGARRQLLLRGSCGSAPPTHDQPRVTRAYGPRTRALPVCIARAARLLLGELAVGLRSAAGATDCESGALSIVPLVMTITRNQM